MMIAEELGLIELVKAIKEERDEKNAPTMGDWIKLNVGGTLFETRSPTLCWAGCTTLNVTDVEMACSKLE